MEIISLNTSLFFFDEEDRYGATCIVQNYNTTIKSFWNHYVIRKHIIDVKSRNDLI